MDKVKTICEKSRQSSLLTDVDALLFTRDVLYIFKAVSSFNLVSLVK